MTAIWRKPAQLAAIALAMLAGPAIAQQPPPALMFWDLGTPNNPSRYQPVSPTNPIPTSGQFFGTLITTTGANSYVVPSGVFRVLIDGCAAGGGNGLGQASASTAGGGGGGAAECAQGYPLSVTPGQTLVVTVGAGVANATGGNTTITGANTAFPTLLGGLVGNPGAAGVGGVGGNGAGPLASAGGASGTSATQPTGVTQLIISGPGGGGGGPTAATGGSGGTTGAYAGGSPGAGNGSGGGGGSTPFGNGGTGGVAGSPGATPTIGYGGGAGGNGSNSATTVAGANGFVLIRS
jgi:hypothetical protein